MSAYYADGEDGAAKTEIKRWGIGAFHNYELSERTSLYVGAGYDQTEIDSEKGRGTQVMFGMTHNF